MPRHSYGNLALSFRQGVTPQLFRGVIYDYNDNRCKLLKAFCRLLDHPRHDAARQIQFCYESSLMCWEAGVLHLQLKIYFKETSIRYAFFVKTVNNAHELLSRYEANAYRVGCCFPGYLELFTHTRFNLNAVAVRTWNSFPSTGRLVHSFEPLRFQELMTHYRENFLEDFISPEEQQRRIEKARRSGEHPYYLERMQTNFQKHNSNQLDKLRIFKNKLINYPLFKYLKKNK